MQLWGGRFSGKMDPQAWQLNASLNFDQRLARQDVRGSLVWAGALEQAGVLTPEEGRQICAGLEAIDAEFANGEFIFIESDEDIHTAVERRLGELIGPLAGKLHTGRSRNDQVATDMRLWLLDHLPALDASLRELQSALIERAENDLEVVMPGYTHLQRAQVIFLGHWWLSHFWPLQRDRERLAQARQRVASLPLGSGALAGVPFEVDRSALADKLGFAEASPNSLDAVSDRDFVAEFLFCAAMIGMHLSRLAEDVVLFSSAEFGYFELSDAYATGSSLMPQKKNPDVFELTRGKAGTLLGYLTALLAVLKGLPSGYDKDLQEDKPPLFAAYDTLMAILPVLADALRSLAIRADRMRDAIDAGLMATDLADYFVDKGLPFRQAHTLVGKLVQLAQSQGKALNLLDLEEIRALAGPAITLEVDDSIYSVFDPLQSISRRRSLGGTAPQAVRRQLEQAKQVSGRF